MPRCNLCLKNHALRHCQVFLSKTIENRRVYIIKWNYCINCMAHTHVRTDCQSSNRCAICGAKHHSMLHRQITTNLTSSSYETQEEPQGVKELPICHTRDIPQEICPQPSMEVHTILPLVRVNLIHKGNPMWVTMLLYPGRETSCLQRSVANLFPEFKPDFSSRNKCYSLFGVSPTYDPRKYYGPIACWRLQLTDFNVKLPPSIQDPQLTEHFRALKPQAHPFFATCRDIDGIIGRRTLATIMKGPIIQPNERLPMQQMSVFGWVIYGRWSGCNCH